MPVVFVHGVPDTQRVWNAVISRLERSDVVTLSLPGFGCPLPSGFAATKEAYVDWLLGELEALTGHIDLVGHDWGALLVVRAVSLRPRIVRTWAAGAAPVDSTYVWHDTARLWQTPEVGEQVMEAMTPEALSAGLSSAGISETEAAAVAEHVDGTMKRCILTLYRSAVRVGAEWEDDLRNVSAPGLVLWGADDPFAAESFGARLAERTGARFVSLPGCSHWWQLQQTEKVVAELQKLWAATA